jgi:hypothetical protein
MITSNGTKLLGKYLVGQVPTFASHIAIGCGPNVLGSDESFGSYSSQTSLDFEMARVPIISRTTNVIDGETQVIFTGTIPSGDRYGITEVGIYPAEESNVFGSPPSKTLFAFTDAEDWQHHDVSAATFYDTEIYTSVVDSNQDIDSGSGGTMENITAFRLASDNAMFRSETRLQRQEQPRFLNRSVVLRGDYTALDGAALDYTLGDHLMLTKPNLAELDKAHAINDKIKVAFSIIPKSLATPVTPTNIQLTIDFAIDDGSVERARLEYTGSTTNNDRYIVVTKTLNELDYTTSFKWENVNYIKIYANIDNGTDNYLALDGIRYENESSVDTQYSLVGYSVLKSSDTVASEYPRPIEKIEGSTTYVEFRFVLDVV